MCVSVCGFVHVSEVFCRGQRASGLLGVKLWVLVNCPTWYWELNSGPLQEINHVSTSAINHVSPALVA